MKKIRLLFICLVIFMTGCNPNSSNTSAKVDNSINSSQKIILLEEKLNEKSQEIYDLQKIVSYLGSYANIPKTPDNIVTRYLQASKDEDWETVYALYDVPLEITKSKYIKDMKSSGGKYLTYKIGNYRVISNDTATVEVSYTYKYSNGKIITIKKEPWACVNKKGFWFVQWLPRQ